MLPAARHELLLVNDSDIRVPSDYLRKVIAPLADASVGLVTCLYRGVASPTAARSTGLAPRSLGHRHRFCARRSERKVSGKRIALRIGLHAGVSPPRPRSHRRLRSVARLSGRRLRTRPPHRRHRQTSRTQRRDGRHISARLHAAPVFSPPTALVAHHSRCPPLGIRRTALHFRPALGIADAARGPRGCVGVVAIRVDVRRAVGRRIRRCGSLCSTTARFSATNYSAPFSCCPCET